MNYFTAKNKAYSGDMKFSRPCGRVRMATSKKERAKKANELLKEISKIKATRR